MLVVDDTEFNRTLISAMLRQAGFRRIQHAVDGFDALRKIDDELPDLVILDIVMPGLDGFEVCRRLRADGRFADLPVLVQTALSNTEDRNKAFQLGTTDLITKPIDRHELLARVRIHLENRMLIQDLQLYRARLENELGMAREMYDHLLPTAAMFDRIRHDSGVHIRHHRAVSSELGGDIWGVIPLPEERFGLYLLDMTGAGVSAALNAFRMHTVLHELSTLATQPARFLTEANARAVGLFDSGERAAMIHGVVDPNAGTFTYATASCRRPILVRRGTPDAILGHADGAPVGEAAGSVYRLRTLPFGPGARLMLYNKAVLAALPVTGPRSAERLLAELAAIALQAPVLDDARDAMIAALVEAVGDRPGQDMTLVFLGKDVREPLGAR
ncbi:transcriptional regulator [Skermanella stibiiresistens SB22]|uniref:Transcriptional regulator n=1 Tax=Skermanella stibiiresistens SB22 TaxID=1385369 RepID=W9H7P1_9PROT|nr:transcriptional regulator [Skermanella stibiiresistens SB22]